jgi:ankyrin repeat protein
VKLQLDHLCNQQTEHDLLLAISELPQGLDETYVRCLEKIQRLGKRRADRCLRVLQWVVGGFFPLTLEELAEVVAVDEMEDDMWDPTRVVTDPQMLVDDCAGLCVVVYDPNEGPFSSGSSKVQLVHGSVRDFLTTLSKSSLPDHIGDFWMDPFPMHLELAYRWVSDYHLKGTAIRRESWPYGSTRWLWMSGNVSAAAEHLEMARNTLTAQHDVKTAVLSFAKRTPLACNLALHFAVNLDDVWLACMIVNELSAMGANYNYRIMGQSLLQSMLENQSVNTPEVLQLLLHYGANPNTPFTTDDLYSVTHTFTLPLLVALKSCSTLACAVLLELGADVYGVDCFGNTAMHVLADSQRSDMPGKYDLLLQHQCYLDIPNEQGERPLHVAALLGNTALCLRLIENGADPNGTDHRGQTALHCAARCRHLAEDTLRSLVAHGCDIEVADKYGRTPLYNALEDNIALFLALGANPNVRLINDDTALHLAAYGGDVTRTSHLLQFGASSIARNAFGTTPLHLATRARSANICALLLEYGADPNALDLYGNSVVHSAMADFDNAEPDLTELFRLLSWHGVDFDLPGEFGASPLMIATLRGWPRVCSTLLSLGANPKLCHDIPTVLGRLDQARQQCASGTWVYRGRTFQTREWISSGQRHENLIERMQALSRHGLLGHTESSMFFMQRPYLASELDDDECDQDDDSLVFDDDPPKPSQKQRSRSLPPHRMSGPAGYIPTPLLFDNYIATYVLMQNVSGIRHKWHIGDLQDERTNYPISGATLRAYPSASSADSAPRFSPSMNANTFNIC